MKALVTGGAGFVGSHVAEYYARKGDEVIVFDNLSRAELLNYDASSAVYNWNHLNSSYENIEMQKGDIRDADAIKDAASDVDVIIHAAAQTAVTTSVVDPRTDFEINALGTFNILEAARLSRTSPAVIFCSTNKVYGDNVNGIPVEARGERYVFSDPDFMGIPETFATDLCEHTPYGASKYAADVYVQDYAARGEVDAAVFRMSCIYGTRQFGVEDQGWVAWFTIATLLGMPITIYGDGMQVRDMLYVTDLVAAFDAFLDRRDRLHHGVYNMGGGRENTMSLSELLNMLEEITGSRSEVGYADWRPSDQKVYISDISKAREELGWKPDVTPRDGVGRLASWVEENEKLF
ncbi:MAG TPA: NAD-dependent epimerase/dehydratase family protein [Methanosarcinales archaeon]|nr:NAD-dependent epimerase/dehydratase family protein [Methanosarcinales archaeon]